jgi:AP endonuclease-2
MLPKTVALPSSYDSFFSFPVKKSGYSGVATYTRIATVTPLKAEEGLTGLIQPKPPFTGQERVSRIENYPPQLIDYDDLDYKHLDSEGRAVTVDFGLFVLINVYCPNDGVGTDERDKYKMDYHRLLSERVRGLQEEGREVIVLGDINVCAALIDHCEGNIMMARARAKGVDDEDEFWEKEYRRWLRDWLQKEDGTGGPLIDIVRRFWPDRKGMYTCELLKSLPLQEQLTHEARLEYEDFRARNKLWDSNRLHPHHTGTFSLDQGGRRSTGREG